MIHKAEDRQKTLKQKKIKRDICLPEGSSKNCVKCLLTGLKWDSEVVL